MKGESSIWELLNIGNSFYNMGDFTVATAIYRTTLHLFESQNNTCGKLTSLNNIGLCYYRQGKFKQAKFLFRTTIKALKKRTFEDHLYLSTIYLSQVYAESGEYDAAIELMEKLPPLRSDRNPDLEILKTLVLSRLYFNTGRFSEGEKACLVILQRYKKVHNEYMLTAMGELAIRYLDHGKTAEAAQLMKEAEPIFNNSRHSDIQCLHNLILYRLNRDQGNMQKALEYLEVLYELKNVNNNDSMRRLIANFETDFIKQQILFEKRMVLEKNRSLQEQQKHQSRLNLFMILAIIVIVILMIFMKGFDSRVEILIESISGFSIIYRWLFFLLLLVYFFLFYLLFMPATVAVETKSFSMLINGLCGIIVYSITFVLAFMGLRFNKVKKIRINQYRFYQCLSFITFFASVFIVFLFGTLDGELSFNHFVFLAMLVFVSYMLPFFGIIIYIESVLLKKYSAMSQIVNAELSEIRKNMMPVNDIASVQSEKTSAQLKFNINDLIAAEAQGNYCMFYLKKDSQIQRKIIHISLKSLEIQLGQYRQIARCHKSFIVNIFSIAEVRGNSRGYFLYFGGELDEVPVSRSFQKSVLAVIRKQRDYLLKSN